MSPPSTDPLGLTASITRRDFFNGALAASGAALIAGCGKTGDGGASLEPSGSPWTGYGGVGDYAWSNGNTRAVADAAHGVRDRRYPDIAKRPIDETVDLIVVGGGFSGMTAAYEFTKRAKPGQVCLLLDNHLVMGGEAKQNEFDVDGRHLTAPQGSNGQIIPNAGYVRGSFNDGLYDVYTDYYAEFGLPTKYDLEPLGGGAEKYNLPDYHFSPMAPAWEKAYQTGYHFAGKGWVRDPTKDAFGGTPWPANVQQELDDFVQNRRDVLSEMDGADAWLDSVTYYDLCDKLGYGKQVRDYIDPYMAVANFGVGGSGVSAFAAKRLWLPGTQDKRDPVRPPADIGLVSFPGGNSAILRTMVARAIPGAIKGDGGIADVAQQPIDFTRLDRPGAPLRIRLGSTAIDVRHDGDPAKAETVIVSYVRDGTIRRIRAKSVVMASGGWVNRNICADLNDTHRAAYAQFQHGPVMVANIALRQWRFFDKLGFTNVRWFEGLGWHACIRRNVAFGSTVPLTPDDPTVLTLYIPFLHPHLPAAQQGPAARQQLFATSYAQFEGQLRTQLTEMFGAAGFDARRDIAGIVLNRWGHAFCAPQPGFFKGTGGAPPPPDVIRQPHGRIVFAHSELQGLMSAAYGMHEAHRGVGQALAML